MTARVLLDSDALPGPTLEPGLETTKKYEATPRGFPFRTLQRSTNFDAHHRRPLSSAFARDSIRRIHHVPHPSHRAPYLPVNQ